MVSYFSFLILIGNGNSFFVNNTVEVGNYFEYTSRHLIMLLGSLSSSVFERRTSTDSELFPSLGSGLIKLSGKSSLYEKRNLAIQICQRQDIYMVRRPHFRLTCVAQKRLCLSSLHRLACLRNRSRVPALFYVSLLYLLYSSVFTVIQSIYR